MGNSNSTSAIEYAKYELQGRRPEMEDATCSLVPFGNNNQQALFGIFDGHFGSRCSTYVAKHLPDMLLRNSHFDNDPKRALIETFFAVDKEFLKWARKEKLTDGSTGIVALIKGSKLFVANTGDSRGVVCENGRAIPLSSDHKPDVPKELERIEKNGGTLLLGRVQGRLGVARSFGDLDFKNSETLEAKYITCEPDVEEHEITENTEFFILACDGLWDKLSNEGAVEFVRERLAKKIPVSTIIKELVQDSYDKGSMDNISAILVVFTHTLKKLQQQQQQQQQQQLRKSAKDTRHVAKSETPTENQATQGHSTAKVPEHSNLSKEAVSPRKFHNTKEPKKSEKETSGDKKDSGHGHGHGKKEKQHHDDEKKNVENKKTKQSEEKRTESSGPQTYAGDPRAVRKERVEAPKSDQPEGKIRKKDRNQEEPLKQTRSNKDKK